MITDTLPDSIKRRATQVLDLLATMQSVYPTATVSNLSAFLKVATDPGSTVGQVQAAIGLPPTSTSRAISVFFSRARGKTGLGLIEAELDYFDARVKRLYLTPEGKRLWVRMQEHLRG